MKKPPKPLLGPVENQMKTLVLEPYSDYIVHVPRAFPYHDGWVGMTVSLTPESIDTAGSLRDPQLNLVVGTSFCSPSDTYRGDKGARKARARSVGGTAFRMSVSLSDLFREGRLVKLLKEKVLNRVLRPSRAEAAHAAQQMGFPVMLMLHERVRRGLDRAV